MSLTWSSRVSSLRLDLQMDIRPAVRHILVTDNINFAKGHITYLVLCVGSSRNLSPIALVLIVTCLAYFLAFSPSSHLSVEISVESHDYRMPVVKIRLTALSFSFNAMVSFSVLSFSRYL